jgi:ribosomal protein S18 acetylase RimI-like enzyme
MGPSLMEGSASFQRKIEVIIMNWTIRKASIDDSLAIAKIKVNGWRTTYKNIIVDSFLSSLSIEEQTEKIRNEIENGQSFYVYDCENQVKGFVWFGYKKIGHEGFDNSIFEIYAIYVDNEEKHKGIGTKLFEYAKQEGIKRDCKNMILWCISENNVARKFYEKLGGKNIGRKTTQIGNQMVEGVCFEFNLL